MACSSLEAPGFARPGIMPLFGIIQSFRMQTAYISLPSMSPSYIHQKSPHQPTNHPFSFISGRTYVHTHFHNKNPDRFVPPPPTSQRVHSSHGCRIHTYIRTNIHTYSAIYLMQTSFPQFPNPTPLPPSSPAKSTREDPWKQPRNLKKKGQHASQKPSFRDVLGAGLGWAGFG